MRLPLGLVFGDTRHLNISFRLDVQQASTYWAVFTLFAIAQMNEIIKRYKSALSQQRQVVINMLWLWHAIMEIEPKSAVSPKWRRRKKCAHAPGDATRSNQTRHHCPFYFIFKKNILNDNFIWIFRIRLVSFPMHITVRRFRHENENLWSNFRHSTRTNVVTNDIRISRNRANNRTARTRSIALRAKAFHALSLFYLYFLQHNYWRNGFFLLRSFERSRRRFL